MQCLHVIFIYFSVETWAVRIGEELWELGLSVSQATDIKAVSQKFLNFTV